MAKKCAYCDGTIRGSEQHYKLTEDDGTLLGYAHVECYEEENPETKEDDEEYQHETHYMNVVFDGNAEDKKRWGYFKVLIVETYCPGRGVFLKVINKATEEEIGEYHTYINEDLSETASAVSTVWAENIILRKLESEHGRIQKIERDGLEWTDIVSQQENPKRTKKKRKTMFDEEELGIDIEAFKSELIEVLGRAFMRWHKLSQIQEKVNKIIKNDDALEELAKELNVLGERVNPPKSIIEPVPFPSVKFSNFDSALLCPNECMLAVRGPGRIIAVYKDSFGKIKEEPLSIIHSKYARKLLKGLDEFIYAWIKYLESKPDIVEKYGQLGDKIIDTLEKIADEIIKKYNL